jgi:hypothetical protein
MSPRVREIYEKHVKDAVKDLSAEERREMIDLIAHEEGEKLRRRHSWKDAIGIAPYPLCGEDAQEWVSRTRRESDEHREPQI